MKQSPKLQRLETDMLINFHDVPKVFNVPLKCIHVVLKVISDFQALLKPTDCQDKPKVSDFDPDFLSPLDTSSSSRTSLEVSSSPEAPLKISDIKAVAETKTSVVMRPRLPSSPRQRPSLKQLWP